MRRRVLVAGLAAAVALVVTTPAYAWWGWTTQAANRTLEREGLTWDTGFEQVYYADCTGQPPRFKHGGRVYWRNFNCYVETSAAPGEDAYFVRLAVKGEHKWKYSFIGYPS